jgi:pyruvate dehydrogenase E2 component (dihydrolipoamide acetyltransferase)
VTLNQPLVEVETEKALVEIPSPFAGVISKLHGDVGEKVQVGSPLVSFETSGEAEAPQGTGRREVLVGYGPEEEGAKRRRRKPIGRRGKEDKDNGEAETAEVVEAQAPKPASAPAPAAKAGAAAGAKALATPPVRKLAREMNVDIETIRGTGPNGRVTREDVVAAAEAPAPGRAETPAAAEPEDERIPVRAIRRSIAEKMVRSATTIPHVSEWLTVDATELLSLRDELRAAPEAKEVKISPLAIVVKALTVALRRHPLINSSWDEEAKEIVVRHAYHVGVATDTERGLLVPVIRNADRHTIFQIAREIGRLVASARDGSIGPGELTGSTITITNVGSFGMEAGTPIINYPECAILAVGAISARPWVVEDRIEPRSVMTLALSFDHRIVDGAEAGRFLRHLGDLIENPARLFGAL